MSIAQSLPEVSPFFMQDCPLCGRSNRMVVKGVYRSHNNPGEKWPDMGYSFCNCKNIFYTRKENVIHDSHILSDLEHQFKILKDGWHLRIIMPDPFFIEWGQDPHSFHHWDVRRNHIIWNMDVFKDECEKIGWEVTHCNHDFNVRAEVPQTFSLVLRKTGESDLIKETELRQSVRAAKEHFGDKPIKIAEIGVLKGEHAELMLSALNIEKLYLIDTWEIVWDYTDKKEVDSNYKVVIEKFSDNPKIDIMRKDSILAAKDIEDSLLDFVYIDANHLYEPVKADIAAWLPKVKSGGIIGGHDYDYPVCPSVKQAVDEAFGDKVMSGQNQNGLHDWWVYV